MLIRFVPGTGTCEFLAETEEVVVPVSPGENFKSILRRTNRFCEDNELPFVFVLAADAIDQCTASSADEALLAVQKLQRDLSSMDAQKLEYEEARESGVMTPTFYYEWLRRFRTARDAKLNELVLAQYKHDMLKSVEADDLLACKRQIKAQEHKIEHLTQRLTRAQDDLSAAHTQYLERMGRVFEAHGSNDLDGVVRLLKERVTKKQTHTARRAIVEWRVIATFIRFINGLGLDLSLFPEEVQLAMRIAHNLVPMERYAGYAPILTSDMEIDTSTFDTFMAVLKAKEKA